MLIVFVPSLCYPISHQTKGDIRINLQFTLQRYALQLKNQPRTLRRVARVFQKIMKTLYNTYFPNAETRCPKRNPDAPDADILTVLGFRGTAITMTNGLRFLLNILGIYGKIAEIYIRRET